MEGGRFYLMSKIAIFSLGFLVCFFSTVVWSAGPSLHWRIDENMQRIDCTPRFQTVGKRVEILGITVVQVDNTEEYCVVEISDTMIRIYTPSEEAR